MTLIRLVNDHSQAVEQSGKKTRLAVYKGNVENVCRKETVKNLKEFIQSNENHSFKGRLHLHKDAGNINVMVKGARAGTFSHEEFIFVVNGRDQPKILTVATCETWAKALLSMWPIRWPKPTVMKEKYLLPSAFSGRIEK